MNPRIVAISGPLKDSTFPIDESGFFIGRSPSCGVHLDDPSVLRKHCSIAWAGTYSMLVAGSVAGTVEGVFVNGFCFPGKILVHGDRIRAGSSIFVYLESHEEGAEPDNGLLKLMPGELNSVTPERTASYEAEAPAVLQALVNFNASIGGIRDEDTIQSRVLDFIFRVMPVEGAAIMLAGHDLDRIVSSRYRRIGPRRDDPFKTDPAVIEKVLREGQPLNADKFICYPLTAHGATIGVIYTVMAAAGVEWFTGSHINLLASIAAPTAVALELARYVGWLEGENLRLTEAINVEHNMIGRSEKMQEIYRKIGRVGPSKTTVLITGESGTGKELVAQAIHRNSPRAGKGLYAVNCGAFTEELLGSELFGHERGAFTSAHSLRKGLFEIADGGTIFLDEIGECSKKMQEKLLRVLQEGEFKREGGNAVLKTDVRVVAATNVDLQKAIKEGRFRDDLFYRLNLVQIHMPRLAERREDIPLLAAHFIKKHGYIRTGPYPPVQGITPEAHRLMASYDWPGNVRELENVIQVAITLGSSLYIGKDDLPKEITGKSPEPGEFNFEKEMLACKKALYEKALLIANGDRKAAARIIGVHPTHLALVCKQLDIRTPRV